MSTPSTSAVRARVQLELCLLLRIVLQDALSEVMKNYPPLMLRFFVYDITALVKGRNKEVAEMAKQVMEKLAEEVEKHFRSGRLRS